jgi:hypothetical protein
MAKYISKKPFDHWWKDLKGEELRAFNRKERKAALIYEFLAREGVDQKKPVYPLGKTWPRLMDKTKFTLVKWGFDIDVRGFKLFPVHAPIESLEGWQRRVGSWSPEYRIQFNLRANVTTVAKDMAALFAEVQLKYAKKVERLAGRTNKPLSFKPVELRDKEMSGKPLTSKERFTISTFVKTHREYLDWCRLVTASIGNEAYGLNTLNKPEDPLSHPLTEAEKRLKDKLQNEL